MDFKDIERAAKEQGWRIEETKKGKRFLSPDGRTIVQWHSTPSDHRALRNFLSEMRRGGLTWPN